MPVLVVEDDPVAQLVYEKHLAGTPFRPRAVRLLREARAALTVLAPRPIVLDLLLPDEEAWTFLTELKRGAGTSSIPVVVATAVDDPGKGMALVADAYLVKPIERGQLVEALERVVPSGAARKILIVDDEEISRYVLHTRTSRGCAAR